MREDRGLTGFGGSLGRRRLTVAAAGGVLAFPHAAETAAAAAEAAGRDAALGTLLLDQTLLAQSNRLETDVVPNELGVATLGHALLRRILLAGIGVPGLGEAGATHAALLRAAHAHSPVALLRQFAGALVEGHGQTAALDEERLGRVAGATAAGGEGVARAADAVTEVGLLWAEGRSVDLGVPVGGVAGVVGVRDGGEGAEGGAAVPEEGAVGGEAEAAAGAVVRLAAAVEHVLQDLLVVGESRAGAELGTLSDRRRASGAVFLGDAAVAALPGALDAGAALLLLAVAVGDAGAGGEGRRTVLVLGAEVADAGLDLALAGGVVEAGGAALETLAAAAVAGEWEATLPGAAAIADGVRELLAVLAAIGSRGEAVVVMAAAATGRGVGLAGGRGGFPTDDADSHAVPVSVASLAQYCLPLTTVLPRARVEALAPYNGA